MSLKTIEMVVPPQPDTILSAPIEDTKLFVERFGGFTIRYKDSLFALIQTRWIMILTPEGKDNENNSEG